MAGYRGTEAYDLSLFEPQVVKQPTPLRGDAKETLEAFEETAKKQRSEEEKKARSRAESARREKVAAQRRLVRAVSFITLALTCMTFLIMARAQTDELTRQIAAVEAQIRTAQSENVRLNTVMNSMVSIDRVETYAEEVLGMVKAQRSQITYIDMSKGDAVMLSGGKSESEETVAAKVKELFAYMQ